MNNNVWKLGQTKIGYDQYTMHSNGLLETSTNPTTIRKLDAGLYSIFPGQQGQTFFIPKELQSDSLLNLPNMTTNVVLEDLKTFWSAEAKQRFQELGLVYKRGILLFGDPGTGKTATITKVIENIIEQDGIIIFNPNPNHLPEAINQLRTIEKAERKILVIYEEFDKNVDDPAFLSLLDGELSFDNVAYIATTNYINKIPPRIKNRPSRFARVIEVGKPNFEDRFIYISNKLKSLYTEEYYKLLAEKTDGMVLDQIKDVLVSTYVFNEKLELALDKVKNLEKELIDEDEEEDDMSYEQQEEYERIGVKF